MAFLLAAAVPSLLGALVMEFIGCMDACRMTFAIIRGVSEGFLGLFIAYAAPASLLFGVPVFLIFREKIAPSFRNACWIGALLGFLPQALVMGVALLLEEKNPIVMLGFFFILGAPLGAVGGAVFWLTALRNASPPTKGVSMSAVRPSPLPEESLLTRYRLSGDYTDSYHASLPQRVSHAEFVEAFYTSWLFKVERLILAIVLFKPSSDEEAKQLAEAETEQFSAWRVESRTSNQLLLMFGNTRSWLMCVDEAESSVETHFYFGSAVIPRVDPTSGRKSFGVIFHLLGGFHRLYSRALLRQALSRLTRRGRRA